MNCYPSQANIIINDDQDTMHLVHVSDCGVNPDELTKLLHMFVSDGHQMNIQFVDIPNVIRDRVPMVDDEQLMIICSSSSTVSELEKMLNMILDCASHSDRDFMSYWEENTGKHIFFIGY